MAASELLPLELTSVGKGASFTSESVSLGSTESSLDLDERLGSSSPRSPAIIFGCLFFGDIASMQVFELDSDIEVLVSDIADFCSIVLKL